jgi:hypothetical protein
MQSLMVPVGRALSRYSVALRFSLILVLLTTPPTRAAAQQIVSAGPVGSASLGLGAVTADGRFVLFNSTASLVPDDTNNSQDAYVRDMQDGTFTRVTVTPGGGQIPQGSEGLAISADGRFVLFRTDASLVPEDTNSCPLFEPVVIKGCSDLYMHDRQTHQVTLVSQSTAGVAGNQDTFAGTMSDDGRFVLFRSGSNNLASGGTSTPNGVFLRDRLNGTTVAVALPNVGPLPSTQLEDVAMSRDGNSILYSYVLLNAPGIQSVCPGRAVCSLAAVMDRATGSAQILKVPALKAGENDNALRVVDISTDGRVALLFRFVYSQNFASFRSEYLLHDRQESRTVSLAGCCNNAPLAKLRADGRQVLYKPDPATDVARRAFRMYDDRTHQSFELFGTSASSTTVGIGGFDISGDGSRVTFVGSGNIANLNLQGTQVYTFKVDTDGDGMPDGWETQFGLDPNNPNDTNADADGDGVTNLQEYLAGTHPHNLFTRYLAEGSSNDVFSTRIAIVNPGSAPATVMLRYLNPWGGGAAPSFATTIAPLSRITIGPAPAGADAGDFSTIVESDAMVVVDRTMSVHGVGHGSQGETAIVQPSTTWYFAEGATGGPFSLFYQLLNPGDAAAQVSVTYLMPAPQPPLTKTYALAPHSRFTIWVDEEDPVLASTDVSARITSDQPIVAERALYLASLNQPMGGVSGGAGVTASNTRWFLAEGATGSFFDLYVLLANPETTDANVTLTYMLPDGTHFTKAYPVAAQSRLTVLVDNEDPRLTDTPVSIVAESTNNVPIVVERAMWWPQGGWYEGHLSVGATVASKKWALAEGEIQGANHVQTYILIANTSSTPGVAHITYMVDPTTDFVFGVLDHVTLLPQTVILPPNSRTSVRVSSASISSFVGIRFGALIQSDVDVVVERAIYWDVDGVTWAAGTDALGTPIP